MVSKLYLDKAVTKIQLKNFTSKMEGIIYTKKLNFHSLCDPVLSQPHCHVPGEEPVTTRWGRTAVSRRHGTSTWAQGRRCHSWGFTRLAQPWFHANWNTLFPHYLPGTFTTRPCVNRNAIVKAATIILHWFFLQMSLKKNQSVVVVFFPLCFYFREKRDDPKNKRLDRVWKENQVRKNTCLPRGHVFSGD